MNIKPILFLAGLLIARSLAAAGDTGASEPALVRLQYNHPGLVVDLGVGLWAWPLPMDFDGDGDLDLCVNCPDKPYNGVYFFENASGSTAENPMPVFRPGRLISKGLQNAQVSYQAGMPVVMTPGLLHTDFLTSGLDQSIPMPLPPNVHPNRVRANMWRLVDYDGDGLDDLIIGVGDWTDYGWDNAWNAQGQWTNGPLRGLVYLARNKGSSAAGSSDESNTASKAGSPASAIYETPRLLEVGGTPIEVFGWPSPNFGDFDADGDLDLICGEFLDGFTWFRNQGTRTEPVYETGVRLRRGDEQPLVMDLQMITPTAIDWDLDGDLDLIVGDEDGRVAFVQHTGKQHPDGSPIFDAPVYFQQEAEDLKFGALATPVGVDWDTDGDMDIVSGNTAGLIGLFKNMSGPGVEFPKWEAPVLLSAGGQTIRIQAGPNGSIQGPCEAKWGYTTLSAADWDHDGRVDLVVNSILGRIHWYRNVGTATEPELAAAEPVSVEWEGAQPELAYGWLKPDGKSLLTQWRTTPVVADWNRDGLNDLIMLDQSGYLAYFERYRDGSELRLRAPRRIFHGENFSVTDSRNTIINDQPGAIQLNNGLAGKSGRRKLAIVDWDMDGQSDLLVNAANARFLRQTGVQDGRVQIRDMGLLVDQNIEGHDVSPAIVDFDGNGIPDFLGGAEDGRFYYLRNPAANRGTP